VKPIGAAPGSGARFQKRRRGRRSTNPARRNRSSTKPNPTDFRPGADNSWSVSISPDGKWIATAQGRGNTKGEVKIWERATGKVKHTIAEPKGVRVGGVFPQDGNTLATGNYDAMVRFYDASTFRPARHYR